MKKNILFVEPSLDGLGGVEKVIPIVADGLSNNNFLVNNLSFYGEISKGQNFWSKSFFLNERKSKNPFIKIYKLFSRVFFILFFAYKTKSKIIIASTDGVAISAIIAKILSFGKIKVIIYLHQSLKTSTKIYQILMKIFFRFANKIVVVSNGLNNEVKKFLNIKNVLTIYNPVKTLNKDEIINNKEYENILKSNENIFITASRIEYIKGIDILIDLFIKYIKNGGVGILIVLGNGSLLSDLNKKVEKNNLKDRIFFFGRVNNIYPYLKYAKCYISTARSEAFGISLVDSLLCGIPIISSDCDFGPREIMSPNLSDNIIYPFKTDYGYLINAPYQNNNTEVSSLKLENSFNVAMNNILKDNFENYILKERGEFFTEKNSVDKFFDLINNLK